MMKCATIFASFAHARDVVSDISDSEEFQFNALGKQRDAFWTTVDESTKKLGDDNEVSDFFSEAEKVMKTVDSDLQIYKILQESISNLEVAANAISDTRRAAGATLNDASTTNAVVEEKKDTSVGSGGIASFLSDAYQRIVSTFTGRSAQGVEQRQEQIIPLLSSAAENTGDVLAAVRVASSKAFDVLKYDIYNKGVPKTPQSAKDLADKCVDMASKLRTKFMNFILGSVLAITNDVQVSRGQKPKVAVDLPHLAEGFDESGSKTQKSAESLKSSDLSAVSKNRGEKFEDVVNNKAAWIEKVAGDINSAEDGMRKGYHKEAERASKKFLIDAAKQPNPIETIDVGEKKIEVENVNHTHKKKTEDVELQSSEIVVEPQGVETGDGFRKSGQFVTTSW